MSSLCGCRAPEGLVHQQDLRLLDQRAHQRGALAACAESRRIGALEAAQPTRATAASTLARARPGHPGELQPYPIFSRRPQETACPSGRRSRRAASPCRDIGVSSIRISRCSVAAASYHVEDVLLPEPNASSATNSPGRTRTNILHCLDPLLAELETCRTAHRDAAGGTPRSIWLRPIFLVALRMNSPA